MAIEVCSEIYNNNGISPRISFSHDLKSSNGSIPVENRHIQSDLRLLDSTTDFVFNVTNIGLSHHLSSADELFSNGKIVPMEIKKVILKSNSNSTNQQQSPQKATLKKRLKEFLSETDNENDEEEEKASSSSSKYFWKFKRSSSLNFDTNPRISLIRSLQFLSRSNSTGSAPNPKKTEVSISRETQKQRLQKQSSVSSSRRSSTSSSNSSTYYFYNASNNKSSLKKYSRSCSSNGVRISPVLNLPQAYIPKATATFFGFRSLFCKGKIKKKEK